MSTYNTPGVYVKEIASFPPSVAQVATAIPAFIGYTKEGYTGSTRVERITSLLEYESTFGKAPSASFTFKTKQLVPSPTDVVLQSPPDSPPTFLMYYAVSLYFQNGGGPCYIVSIGSTKSPGKPDHQDFINGLDALRMEDEPTLIVFPDAINLSDANNYYSLAQQALSQCHDLGDRFLILDIPKGKKSDDFRSGVSSEYLSYAAAYHPYLSTTLSYIYDESEVKVVAPTLFSVKIDNSFTVTYSSTDIEDKAMVKIENTEGNNLTFNIEASEKNYTLTISAGKDKTAKDLDAAWKSFPDNKKGGFDISVPSDATGKLDQAPHDLVAVFGSFSWEQDPNGIKVSYVGQPSPPPTIDVKIDTAVADTTFVVANHALTITLKASQSASAIVGSWNKFDQDKRGFDISLLGNGTTNLDKPDSKPLVRQSPISLDVWKKLNSVLYSKVKSALSNIPVILPPSAAIAGIYARVDRDRGVWKTPANVPVLSVIAPVTKISDADQDLLNVDTTSGKSINAIRAFAGKGTLVWGGRTLAGNDNEWRYISVRRLFITIEESARKASAFAVFEPNDATTWLKVKAMIESYLYGLWEQGALAGPKPEAAFFVSVGLGKTMTPQDVLEGRMIVRIGIAAVRPAEFIILEFTHKLQEA